MKRISFLIILVSLITALISAADLPENKVPFISSLKISAAPAFPVGTAGSMYRLGAGGDISAHHRLKRLPFLNFQTGIGFRGSPLLDNSSSVLFTNVSLGTGLEFEIVPRFNFEAFISGGVYSGHLLDPSTNGFGAQITAGVLFGFDVSERWRLGVGSSFRSYFGLANQISADLAASYRFDFHLDDPFQNIPMNLEPYYPVLYSYYGGGMPIGRIGLVNEGDAEWRKLDVVFNIPGVSQGKYQVPAPSELPESDTANLALIGDFGNKSGRIDGGQSVDARADIGFRYKGWRQSRDVDGKLSIYNASFTEDPATSVLFVSSTDPVIRLWAAESTDLDLEVTEELNRSLTVSAAIYNSLKLAGYRHTSNGTDAWKEILASGDSVERFPFPRDRIVELEGDRSETAILMAALLEAAAAPAGLAIIDGYLWPAVALGEGVERINIEYSRPEDIVIVDGVGWMVLDMSINSDFLTALASGAESWRQSSVEPQLISCREHWPEYPQTGYSRDPYPVEMPDTASLLESYKSTIDAVIRWEIDARKTELLEILDVQPDNIDKLNELGALLARYGLRDESVEWFERVLLLEDDSRSLVNMGNVEYLRGDLTRARTYYNQAERVDPFNSFVLLGIARVSFEQENFGNSRDAYSKLEIVDPELADRFSILTGTGPDALQAALDSELRRVVFWLD